MTAEALDLIDRFSRMEQRRNEWDDWYQALGDVFLPNQADFTNRNARGKKRDVKNYENSHRVAARNFTAALGSFVGPQDVHQLTITPDDEELIKQDEVRLWLDDCRDRMWRAMGRTRARYSQAKSETDYSLTVFGTGVLFIGENAARDGLLFRSHHLRDAAIGTNAAGEVDRIGFRRRLTAQQAAEEYGKNNLGQKLKEELEKDPKQTTEKRFAFVHLVLPREDRDARKINAQNMAFASVVIDVESEHIVRERGFHEFPYAVPRWETSPEEIYGRSPAMLAYSDARTLQAIAKTLLLGGQRAVDPPTWVLNDAVFSAVRTYPGGVTVLDSQSAAAQNGRPPLGVLDLGKNIPLGREMQEDYRVLVQQAFFRDLFINSTEGPQMTATEILERKEEMVRVLGPTFGRLEEDYVGRVVTRVFNIMERAGAFAERPEILQDRELDFSYHSPFQQARKSSEAVGLSRSMEMLGPIAQLKPEVLDNYDTDAIARDTPDWFGFAQKYILPEDRVAETRQQRAQQQQAAQQAEMLKEGGGLVKNIASAEKDLGQQQQ